MDGKTERVINLYHRLIKGELLVKSVEAERFKVNGRSIQRDIDDIRACLSHHSGDSQVIKYNRALGGYLLVEDTPSTLSDSEIFGVCKILLESRSMLREEMFPIIDKLLENCVRAPASPR